MANAPTHGLYIRSKTLAISYSGGSEVSVFVFGDFLSLHCPTAWQTTCLSFRRFFFSSSLNICRYDLRTNIQSPKVDLTLSIIAFLWPKSTCRSAIISAQSDILTASTVPNHSFPSHKLNVSFSLRNDLMTFMFPSEFKVGERL